MHRVTKPIALGVAGLFGAGLITAAAASKDVHGDAVRVAVIAAKAMLTGEARGDAVSVVASAKGQAARADAIADKAERAADKAAKGNRDAHGDAVSMVARSDATAAHKNGKKKVNHGGAVSAAAHMR